MIIQLWYCPPDRVCLYQDTRCSWENRLILHCSFFEPFKCSCGWYSQLSLNILNFWTLYKWMHLHNQSVFPILSRMFSNKWSTGWQPHPRTKILSGCRVRQAVARVPSQLPLQGTSMNLVDWELSCFLTEIILQAGNWTLSFTHYFTSLQLLIPSSKQPFVPKSNAIWVSLKLACVFSLLSFFKSCLPLHLCFVTKALSL